MLGQLGIAHLARKPVFNLSIGQQQRVAVARALVNKPTIIMGDEPTGNLDSVNTGVIFDIFQQLAHEHNQTLIVVTHDDDFAKRSDRTVVMSDGKII